MTNMKTSVQPFILAATGISVRKYTKLTDSQKSELKKMFLEDKEWSATVVRRLCKTLDLSKATVRRWHRTERKKKRACESREFPHNLNVSRNLMKHRLKIVGVYTGRREKFRMLGSFKDAV